jgi:NTP pyrophosphatase (non-canonical NTP hydrolase)
MIRKLYNDTPDLGDMAGLTTTWAHERGILTNGKTTTQALKLMSEAGELANSVLDCLSYQDDVGDCLVVINNIAQLEGYSFMDCWVMVPMSEVLLGETSCNTSQAMALLMASLGELCDNVAKGKDCKEDLANVIALLIVFADGAGLNLLECWDYAYDEIKDRKGFLNEHGNFIKESDPAYEQLKLRFEEAQ